MESPHGPLELAETMDYAMGSCRGVPENFRSSDGSLVRIGRFLGGTEKTCVHCVYHEGYGVPLVGKFSRCDVDGSLRDRMHNEAKFLAAIDSSRVPRVREWGEIDGRPYILMDYHPGISLEARIGRAGGRPFPLPVVRRIGLDLARALADVHNAGIVHRDVKPGNILVGDDGITRILDFGLAFRRTEDIQRITHDGMTLGTPKYLDPQSRDSRHATPAADVYALGIVLLELARGMYPFTDDQVRVLWEGTCDGKLIQETCERHLAVIQKEDADLADILRSILAPGGRPTAHAIAERLEQGGLSGSKRTSRRMFLVATVTAGVAAMMCGVLLRKKKEHNPLLLIGRTIDEAVTLSSTDGSARVYVVRMRGNELNALGVRGTFPEHGVMCTVFCRNEDIVLCVPGSDSISLTDRTAEDTRAFVLEFPDVDGEINIPDGFPGNETSWRSTVRGRLRVLRERSSASR